MRHLFPAHAGVIPDEEGNYLTLETIPRPRGGDPNGQSVTLRYGVYSPPTRG